MGGNLLWATQDLCVYIGVPAPTPQQIRSDAQIARDVGIGANLLGQWYGDANADAEAAGGQGKVPSQEYERMRRELAKVKTERDILKKALGYFAADLK